MTINTEYFKRRIETLEKSYEHLKNQKNVQLITKCTETRL